MQNSIRSNRFLGTEYVRDPLSRGAREAPEKAAREANRA